MMQYRKVFYSENKPGKFWKFYRKVRNYIRRKTNKSIYNFYQSALFFLRIDCLDISKCYFSHTSAEDALNDPRLITPGMEDEEIMREIIAWPFITKDI